MKRSTITMSALTAVLIGGGPAWAVDGLSPSTPSGLPPCDQVRSPSAGSSPNQPLGGIPDRNQALDSLSGGNTVPGGTLPGGTLGSETPGGAAGSPGAGVPDGSSGGLATSPFDGTRLGDAPRSGAGSGLGASTPCEDRLAPGSADRPSGIPSSPGGTGLGSATPPNTGSTGGDEQRSPSSP